MKKKLTLIASILTIFAVSVLFVTMILQYALLEAATYDLENINTGLYDLKAFSIAEMLISVFLSIIVFVLAIIIAKTYKKGFKDYQNKKRTIIANISFNFIILATLFIYTVITQSANEIISLVILGSFLFSSNILFLIDLLHEDRVSPEKL